MSVRALFPLYGSMEFETQKTPLLTQKQSVRRRRPPPGRAEPSQRRQMMKKVQQSKPVLSKIFNASDVRAEAETDHHHHHHSLIYTALNPKSNQKPARIFKWFIAIVILVDLVFFIVSTEPNLPQQAQYVFKVAEGVTSSIFLVEYVLRLVTCTESRKYNKGGHVVIMGRLRYMVTPGALIDCLATFPFFVERFTGWDLPTLTYLRVFRLLRIGKTQGYGKALEAVYRVIYYNREILHVALLVCTFLILLTAILMYYLRPQNPDDAQDFTSIAATMYLSTLMLTGQGGPGGDLPWYTKAVVVLTGVFSVAMFAIPASMLTWGFVAEAARLAAKAQRRKKRGGRDSSSSSSSSGTDSGSISTSDEEYQKIIAGEEGDEDDRMKEWMERFEKADGDKSGTLTMAEFVNLGTTEQQTPLSVHHSFVRGKGGESLLDRMEQLERKVDATSKKLDEILSLLKDKTM